MHRLVAREFIDNTEDETDIDPIDHNTKHNCISNLRWCSKSENNMNRNKIKIKQCSSCFKGVSWHKQHQRWRTQIKTYTGRTHIGIVASEIDAARAYNEKATELFAAFAHLNILQICRKGFISC